MVTSEFKPDILVVEDDRDLGQYLKDFYSKLHHHRVLIATNADKAIRAADQNRGRPTVALLDIGLPGRMNGIHLLKHLSHYAPHVAAYVITGRVEEDLHRQAKWAGALEVFVKPVDEDDLLRAVKSPVVTRLVTNPLHDFLTGLQHRWVFEDVANGQILAARRCQEVLSLLFVDVNDFKAINDGCSHETGDEALRLVAAAIRGHLRAYDHSCRWGGDEFATLLPGVDEADAHRIAETLKKAVRKITLTSPKGERVELSISVGVTALIPKDRGIAVLVRRADEAMYRDKEAQKVGL